MKKLLILSSHFLIKTTLHANNNYPSSLEIIYVEKKSLASKIEKKHQYTPYNIQRGNPSPFNDSKQLKKENEKKLTTSRSNIELKILFFHQALIKKNNIHANNFHPDQSGIQ